MHKSAGAKWRGRPLAAVLFDLDGTLLDTVADIALALNRTLAECGCKSLAENDVRRMIGRGSPILIERAAASQGRIIDDTTHAAMLQRLARLAVTAIKNSIRRCDPRSARRIGVVRDADESS